MSDIKKVVLAYSGGLDTSVILKWLQDNYQCEIVTFTANLGQGEELEPARAKAIKFGIICGYTSVILVMLLGQSRVFYSMSRDGLLWSLFSDIHPKWLTPWKSNLLFCVAVSVMAAFLPMTVVGEMTSIGTLFAFALVSLGVIILRRTQPDRKRVFRVPMVPWFPLISIVLCGGLMTGLTVITWVRFIVWLVLGLMIYFFYSRHRSEFARK